MQQGIYEITENQALTGSVYRMRLQGDVRAFTAPGQFLNIKIDGLFLRRPISLCDQEGDVLTILYKTVGEGTRRLSQMQAGEKLDILTGLGNGYDLTGSGQYPLLVGGGVGVPPLYLLARELCRQGKQVCVVMGFNTREEIFYEREFADLGCKVYVTTVDGSYGISGFVTDALPKTYTSLYACGPQPMLRALYRATTGPAQFSFEERMGCGFGACMGCSCRTITGYKRICKDGPVLRREEIRWED